MRTIAIGLDGCSWNVLDPLLETGQLPNLAALRDRSAHGVLESTIPFFTGAAWASYATGCSPAAHGIYDFMMLREDRASPLPHRTICGARRTTSNSATRDRDPYSSTCHSTRVAVRVRSSSTAG